MGITILTITMMAIIIRVMIIMMINNYHNN